MSTNENAKWLFWLDFHGLISMIDISTGYFFYYMLLWQWHPLYGNEAKSPSYKYIEEEFRQNILTTRTPRIAIMVTLFTSINIIWEISCFQGLGERGFAGSLGAFEHCPSIQDLPCVLRGKVRRTIETAEPHEYNTPKLAGYRRPMYQHKGCYRTTIAGIATVFKIYAHLAWRMLQWREMSVSLSLLSKSNVLCLVWIPLS